MLIAAAMAGGSIDVTTLPITYTGNMTDEIVTMGDGKQYRLLTLTSSGTLTTEQPVVADIWLCGGGANGISASGSGSGAGGGGGFVGSIYKTKIGTTVSCVVGAATGSSSFGSIVSANGAKRSNGGSGGGARGYGFNSPPPGTGAGISTYPFLDTTYFPDKPHCAGGGGGSTYSGSSSQWRGGTGGSNGSDGGNYVNANAGYGGVGGLYGGGSGGSQGGGGRDGYHYGSGGGGGGCNTLYDMYGSGGAGYQGVIYVRIPLDQRAA